MAADDFRDDPPEDLPDFPDEPRHPATGSDRQAAAVERAQIRIMWRDRAAQERARVAQERRAENRRRTVKGMLWGVAGAASASALPTGWLLLLWQKLHALWSVVPPK